MFDIFGVLWTSRSAIPIKILFFIAVLAQLAFADSQHVSYSQHGANETKKDFGWPGIPVTADEALYDEFLNSLEARQLFPPFPNTWEGRVNKGRYLKCLFPLTNAAAQTANNGNPIVSQFTDPRLLQRWGWNRQEGPGDGGTPGYGTALDEAFNDPAYKVNTETQELYSEIHDEEFVRSDGSRGDPTQGQYSNIMNPKSGTLIADNNFSPGYYSRVFREGHVPDLNQWSDIVYFHWLEQCQLDSVSAGSISLFFRANIIFEDTVKWLKEAMRKSGRSEFPNWANRATFTMDQDEGLALLATSHGSGPAIFLLQHKEGLGLKAITEITVWSNTGPQPLSIAAKDSKVCMRIVVKNAT